MQTDQQLISRLEKLARLRLNDAEREKFGGELQRILDMVDKLQTLNTDGVDPLIWMNENEDIMRQDEIASQLTTEAALLNAPKTDEGYFSTPKVIES